MHPSLRSSSALSPASRPARAGEWDRISGPVPGILGSGIQRSSGLKTAWIFPGQGSQRVGMGRAWFEASVRVRETFAEASRVLEEDIAELCFEGPEERLVRTENAQPAILTLSVAVARELQARGHEPDAVAGHSLGEYSAHVVAGTIELPDALRLVRRRGQLMQEAVPIGAGAMAAVLLLAPEAVAEVAAQAAAETGGICTVANDNAPDQVVLSGHAEAVARAGELARQRGARKVVPLSVSAPFHCPLMRPAREGLEPDLRRVAFRDPRVPVVPNVAARPTRSAQEAREALIHQIDGPVRWTESVRCLVQELGIDAFLEVGPGNVLAGLVRKIAPGVAVASTPEPSGIPDWLEGKAVRSEV